MIPKNITRQHVLAAIAQIDRLGTPDARSSRKFMVVYNGNRYPPKYLVSLANKYANAAELPPSAFNGGAETNDFLLSLGFTVNGIPAHDEGQAVVTMSNAHSSRRAMRSATRQQSSGGTTPQSATGSTAIAAAVNSTHSGERCKNCKHVGKTLLERIYGPVQQNYQLNLGTRPEDYGGTACHAVLSKIYSALQLHRGFMEFVGTKTLPPSDFFVANPGFVVEFDESQHFTELRYLALSLYPNEPSVGFDLVRWMTRCKETQARDNDPPYRDEQRAWYDTLRDFASQIKGMMPTLRLHASGFTWNGMQREWCSLDPDSQTDVETFRHILGEWTTFWRLDYKIPNDSQLVRIAIDGAWRGSVPLAKQLLNDICNNWPAGVHVRCLSTCGAFLVFDWPDAVQRQKDNRFPDTEAVKIVDSIARENLQELLSDGLRERLASYSRYLSIGIDSYKSQISSTDAHIPDNHAELVYVVNLKTGDIHFTGKSYPTPNQERGLLRVLDLDSHFVTLDGISTMVLGCHDLNIFHPRSDAKATGWRLKTKNDFKSCAQKQMPRWILHHPHTTVKSMTWRHAWTRILQELPSVKSYLGTGCYSYRDRRNGLERERLESVLRSTKSPDVGDVIVHLAAPSSINHDA